jgi:argininosuccinate lyase
MKLWDKGGDLDARIERFTVGGDHVLDLRLVAHDCAASAAHARMLARLGVLTAAECAALEAALAEIAALAAAGRFEIRQADEDCHTAIEAFLTARLGDAGRKIHTGRSRNDQVLTALRLFEKERLGIVRAALLEYGAALDRAAARLGDVALPGYTHMQRAMPTTVGAWLGGFRAAVDDDVRILDCAAVIVDQCPLGTAAGFGVPVLALDRATTARELGFSRVTESPAYAQLGRGKIEALVIGALAQILLDLNRLASDLALFATREFGFVRLPEALCTGSSIMPQKRNPDVLELVRARYHVVLGEQLKVQGLLANLMSGYQRDAQLTKEPVMRALDETEACLGIMPVVLDGMELDRAACAAALTDDLYATERALALVAKGVPFREAYREVAADLAAAAPAKTPDRG